MARVVHGHAFASPLRPFVGVLSVALMVASLQGCGGGGDDASSAASAGAGLTGREAAQNVGATAPTGVVSGEGWAVQPPVMNLATTYTAPQTGGKTYYIDPDVVSDDAGGGTIDRPWKYLWRVGAKKDWQPGDAVLLKCGGVWRGQDLSINGAADANPSAKNIRLIGAYGCDQNPRRPLISGASPLPVVGGAVWSAEADLSGVMGINLSGPVKRLYVETRTGGAVDARPLTPARFPNEEPGRRFTASTDAVERLTNESDEAFALRRRSIFKMSPADVAALNGRDIKGAAVYVRTNPYTIERGTVGDFNSATRIVTLETALKFPIEATSGYFFEGKPWMVDQPGEWALKGHRLLHGGAVAPDTRNWVAVLPRATSQNEYKGTFGIQLSQMEQVSIEYIRMEYNDLSITLDRIPAATVKAVESFFADDGGISASVSPDLKVLNSVVDASGLTGIRIFTSPRAQVVGNVVNRTGMFRVANPDWLGAWGIRVFGEGSLVADNLVKDSSNVGIMFNDLPGTVVRHNTVIRPCRLLTDCGGIYTSNEVLETQNLGTITSQVYGNVVAGLVSNLDGAYIHGALKDLIAGQDSANGIYLDDRSATVEVFDNVIVGAEVGIYLHNSAHNVIRNNRTEGITYASLHVSSDNKDKPWITRGNQILNNTFFSRRTVDPAAFANVPYKGVRGKPVYAQMWRHTTQNVRTFFQDSAAGAGDRNVSSGNGTLTLTQVQSPTVWRLEAADRRQQGSNLVMRMEQVSGANWGLKSFYEPDEQLGLAEWLKVVGKVAAPDTESSPVSFRTHQLTSTGGTMLANGAFAPKVAGWTASAGSLSYLMGSSLCQGLATTCGVFKATGPGDRVTSQAFDLQPGALYQASYTVAASTLGARHSAHIGTSTAPATPVATVSTPFTLAGAEKRRIETFVRSATGARATLSLRGSDGTSAWLNKLVYLSDAALQPVGDAVIALPPLHSLGLSVVNASTQDREFDCATLAVSDCSRLVDADNQSVPARFVVPARQTKRLYVRLPGWVN